MHSGLNYFSQAEFEPLSVNEEVRNCAWKLLRFAVSDHTLKWIELVLSRKIVKIMTGMILMGILLLYQWMVSPIDQFNIGPGVNGPCAIASFHKILKYWQKDIPVAELISLANDQYNLLKRWTSAKYQLGRLSLLAEKYNLSCLYCRGDQSDIEKLCKLGIPV
ncbi:MAG: hypothetical protein ACD_39C01522G0001, partial [uncultured bacterium]